MRPYQNQDLFAQNLKALGRIDPVIAKAVQLFRPGTRPVLDDGGDVNLDLGGGSLLYPSNAKSAVSRQVDNYLADPNRLIVMPQQVYEDCRQINQLQAELAGDFAALGNAAFGPFGGYLIVFGLGLGHHLAMLAQKLNFKTMVVVEGNDDFWVASCHAVDWKSLAERLRRDGRELRLIRAKDVYQELIKTVRGDHFPLLGGSYLFFHYQAPEFAEFSRRYLTEWQDLAMMTGWVEDQLTMLRNNEANFSRPGFAIQRAPVSSRRQLPAIVVGAGPSLDQDIETIRALRGQAVVISASSALRVLLENGIRPDIHCELENGAGLSQVAQDLAHRHGGLDDITLYAASVVDPGIAPHFKQVVYYFRSRLSSTVFFADGAQTTRFADPTSGNAAVRCALSMGFGEVYLFGLDFGARDPKAHHSSHSVYFNYESESELETYTPYEFDRQVPGNFGGTVVSGNLLNWGRASVTASIREFFGVRVFNCSDGARIEGAQPLAADELSLAPLPAGVEARAEVDAAFAQFTFYPEGLCKAEAYEDLRRLHHTLLDRFRAYLGEIDVASPVPQMEVVRLWDKINSDLTAQSESPTRVVLLGHMEAAVGDALYYLSMVALEDHAAGTAAVIRRLGESLDRLAALIDDCFGASHHG